LLQKSAGKQERSYKVVTWGFYGGGSTTGLHQLKLGPGEEVSPFPSIGLEVEKIEVEGTSLIIWDLGGRERFRSVWRTMIRKADALVFYVDSTERGHDRHEFMRDSLDEFLSQVELEGVPILICANKQDLPNAMTAAEVMEALQLSSLKGHAWHVQPTSTKTGDGLREGMAWLLKEVHWMHSTISEKALDSGKVWLEGIIGDSGETVRAASKPQQAATQVFWSWPWRRRGLRKDEELLKAKSGNNDGTKSDKKFAKRFVPFGGPNFWNPFTILRPMWHLLSQSSDASGSSETLAHMASTTSLQKK